MLVPKTALRLYFLPFSQRNILSFGGFFKVRMGERSVRIREVKGSNPSRSIKNKTSCRIPAGRFAFYADLEKIRKGRPAAAGSQSPSGALASPWVPTSRNVYRGCCRSCRIPAGHFLLVFRFNALSKNIAECHIIIYGSDCSIDQGFPFSITPVDVQTIF